MDGIFAYTCRPLGSNETLPIPSAALVDVYPDPTATRVDYKWLAYIKMMGATHILIEHNGIKIVEST